MATRCYSTYTDSPPSISTILFNWSEEKLAAKVAGRLYATEPSVSFIHGVA